MSNKLLVPISDLELIELDLSEFTNAWEQKKLRNVVSYHSSMMIA